MPSDRSIVIAAGTAVTTTVTNIDSSRVSALHLIIKPTTADGSNTVQVTVNGISASGVAYLLLASAALATTAVVTLRVGPGLSPSANAVANDFVPDYIQVVATVVGAPAYGVDMQLFRT